MKSNIVGFIFARGGSKGVPRKNVRLLAGKPLIGYAIETARASRFIHRVVVSTDDDEIASVARQFGAEVPFMRPEELARDDSPEWLAWRHAIRSMEELEPGLRIDVFVCIPTTSPLREVIDVDDCIRALVESDADMVITVKSAHRNPYFNMVVLDDRGYANLVIPSSSMVYHRQQAPRVYDMTTVAYAARPGFIMEAKSWLDGKIRAVLVPEERAIDIDTELDLQFAEFLISRRLGGTESKSHHSSTPSNRVAP